MLNWRNHSAIVRGLCIVRECVIVIRSSTGTELSSKKRAFHREARSCCGIAAMASCSRVLASSFFLFFSSVPTNFQTGYCSWRPTRVGSMRIRPDISDFRDLATPPLTA